MCELAEEEWNFIKCPPEQLMACESYEYAREATRRGATKIIAAYRKNEPDTYQSTYWTNIDFTRSFSRIWLPPEFPDTPFLKLPLEYRADNSHNNISDEELVYKQALFPQPPVQLADNLNINDSHFSCTITINWSPYISNEEYIKYLRKLLIQHRPENMKNPDIGKSSIRSADANLRTLAACRLIKSCGGVTKAINYLKKIKGIKTNKKHPYPYTTEHKWYKASEKVKTSLKLHYGLK